MTTPAATLATFVSVRPVQGRKVYQLVMEVAMEQANDAVQALGGLPQSDDPKWVGIALVETTGRDGADRMQPLATPAAEEKGRDTTRQSKRDSRTFQAVMACKTEQFREWVRAFNALDEPITEDWAADWVRRKCDIRSRSQLDTNVDRGKAWDAIYGQYQKDMGLMAEER